MDKDKPLISVIIPVYNVSDYIQECVNSVIHQTYKYLEIILVDDGSSDNSGELCDQLKETDNRITVIHKKNGGLSSARNAGIDIATGQYLGFVDSDDWIDTSMYEKLMNNILVTGKDIACCGRFVVSENGKNEELYVDTPGVCFSNKEALGNIFELTSIDVAAWDKLYSKKLFSNIRYPEGEINEDAAIIVQLLKNSNGVVHAGQPLYYYRQRWGSITKSGYSKKLDVIYKHLLSMQDELNLFAPELSLKFNTYIAYASYCMVIKILRHPETLSEYKYQYNIYIQMLSHTFWRLLLSNSISIKDKVRCVCAVLRIFKPIYCLTHKNQCNK
jgi:glycosyltransferase involved in cell wall biosynthesis